MTANGVLRTVRSFSHEVPAGAGEVFSLLCPVREYDWVPGWSCEVICSKSGIAELGCVFRRDDALAGSGVWVVSRYEPCAAIGFVITYPQSHVERLTITLGEAESGTRLLWSREYTAWTQRGREVVEMLAGPEIEGRMAMVMRALEHYCRTGKMIDAGAGGGGAKSE